MHKRDRKDGMWGYTHMPFVVFLILGYGIIFLLGAICLWVHTMVRSFDEGGEHQRENPHRTKRRHIMENRQAI